MARISQIASCALHNANTPHAKHHRARHASGGGGTIPPVGHGWNHGRQEEGKRPKTAECISHIASHNGLHKNTARQETAGRDKGTDGDTDGGRSERDRRGKGRPPRALRDRTHLADGQPRGLHNAQSTPHGRHDHAGHGTRGLPSVRRAAAFQQPRRISHTGCWRPMGWWGDPAVAVGGARGRRCTTRLPRLRGVRSHPAGCPVRGRA